jgi:chitinase
MGNDANACVGHVGESCGWTTTNLGQGYHCQPVSWGTGCEPGGMTCPNGSSSSSTSSSSTSSTSSTSSSSSSSSTSSSSGGPMNPGLVFSAYKDTSINMNWNTNVITTSVSGSPVALATDLTQHGGKSITLAFATGECGSENWGGVQGDQIATANVSLLTQAGVRYILSTGGAAGSFTCGSDGGMSTFINRWASSGLVGVDFDIEAGQSQAVISDLISRVKTAHGSYPSLRFSLTLATLANNNGASSAQSLGGSAPDSFNTYGDWSLQAVQSVLGFNGSASSWPSYLTVNLMTMDYGSASSGVCVVSSGACQMGQSALQAAYNLHDHWGVPYANIELTPMIGGNDASSEVFSLADADAIASFAISHGLAGIHYWSYDRDTDCPPGSASPICNSVGSAGSHGYLKRFLADGLH